MNTNKSVKNAFTYEREITLSAISTDKIFIFFIFMFYILITNSVLVFVIKKFKLF